MRSLVNRVPTIANRDPAWAGRFYPESPDGCRREIETCLRLGEQFETAPAGCVGGIVPHAGWVYSGAVAGAVLAAITRPRRLETVILFGAVHRLSGRSAAVYDRGIWRTPLGDLAVDEELAASIIDSHEAILCDRTAHESEHSIEVQVPFLQHLMPTIRMVPVMVPPSPEAAAIGKAVGRTVRECGRSVAVIGTTDLTHYGPQYGFTPQGVGESGLRWAKEVNDRRMIDRILKLDPDQIVAESVQHRNACGGGAVAATMAACEALGATDATLLCHTTSREAAGRSDASDAVGYAGIVFHTAGQPMRNS